MPPFHVPIPIIDFATLQHLNPVAPVFSPRPVTASSSASDVAAMFRTASGSTPLPHSHPTVSVPLAKPAKRLLFRSPLLKGKGVKQALAWNLEQLLDLRGVFGNCDDNDTSPEGSFQWLSHPP
jgi:hypothetical protein